MDLKQIILISGLFLLAACTDKKCHSEEELKNAARMKMRHLKMEEDRATGVAPESPYSCPVDQFRGEPQESYNERSLSPWRYQTVTDASLFPSTYAEAKCLCSGCIQFQDNEPWESDAYNSVPLIQSRMFLKKEPCGNNTYHLTPINKNVAVGCTCVRPRTQ